MEREVNNKKFENNDMTKQNNQFDYLMTSVCIVEDTLLKHMRISFILLREFYLKLILNIL